MSNLLFFRHFIVLTSFIIAGVLGIKVKIMLPWDPTGKNGPKKPLPDNVNVVEPKEEVIPVPTSEGNGNIAVPVAV